MLLKIIPWVFDLAAKAFDAIPVLNKLKGFRSAIGLVLLGVVEGLAYKGVLDPETTSVIRISLEAWVALSLNAKGR